MEKHDVAPLNHQVLKSHDSISIEKPILKNSSSLATVSKIIPAPNCAISRTGTIEALAAVVVKPKKPSPPTTKALTTWQPPLVRPTSFADPALFHNIDLGLDATEAQNTYKRLRLRIRRILFGTRGVAAFNFHHARLPNPTVKGKSHHMSTSTGPTPVPSNETDYDLQRRLNKMSWGESPHGSGGSSDGTQRLRAGGGGGLGRAILKVTWFGMKVAFLSSLCVWTANEGLWGSYEEAKQFHIKLEDMIRKLPSLFEAADDRKTHYIGTSKVNDGDQKTSEKK